MKDNNTESVLFVATKAVIVFNEKVLLLREAGLYKDGTNVGRYDLPGGRLKPGEHFQEALKREVLEETGLAVVVGDPVAVCEWRPVVRGVQWQVVGIFFECHADSAEVVLSGDHDQYEWINPREYKKYNIIDNLEPVFEKYLNR